MPSDALLLGRWLSGTVGQGCGARSTYPESGLGPWYQVGIGLQNSLTHTHAHACSTFDTANLYSNGDSERVLAKFIEEVNISWHLRRRRGS